MGDRTRRPSLHQLELAAEWLRANEAGDGDPEGMSEQEACHKTADWLVSLVEKAEEDAAVRRIIKEVPTATKALARQALKRSR
jgi:hypothetical protein